MKCGAGLWVGALWGGDPIDPGQFEMLGGKLCCRYRDSLS